MGRDLTDGISHHSRRRRRRPGRDADRHRTTRRCHAVQRRPARGFRCAGGAGHRLRCAFGDPERVGTGHPIGVVDHVASGTAGQGADRRRHRLAATARPRPGHVDLRGQLRPDCSGRDHLDIGITHRHRNRSGRTGLGTTELLSHLGRRGRCDHRCHSRDQPADAVARGTTREYRRPQGPTRPGRPPHRVAQTRPR